MTFMRNIYRQAWCHTCRDLTPHDEHGNGLCMYCQWDIEDWLTQQEAPAPTSSTTVTNGVRES